MYNRIKQFIPKKLQNKVIIIGILFLLGGIVSLVFFSARKTQSAALTSASATLSNPRLSYKAGVGTGTSLTTTVTIDGSGNPDVDTNHVFRKDSMCFTPSVIIGCRDNAAYTVVGIGTSLTFDVTPALQSTLGATDYAIATQSGQMSLSFTLASSIPVGGDIYITIPMADNQNGNDYFPDNSGTTTSTGGFDLGGITTGDVTVTESCGGTFTVAAVTAGSGTTDHIIRIDNSVGECAASTALTIGIGSTVPGQKQLINPASVTTGRVRGTAEVYTVNVKTRNVTDVTLDESNVLVAPVEAVFVSATVQETMSFRVCGVKTDLSTQESTCFSTPATICNQAVLDAASYAYSVPFGTFTTGDTPRNLAQYLKGSTNASGGFTVKIQQTDEMGKDGTTCTSNPTAVTNCIPDNIGDGGTLDYNNTDECTATTNNGLCFSADDGPASGYTPTFNVKYGQAGQDCASGFCARVPADRESAQDPQTVFYRSAPSTDSDAFICWRLSVDAIQAAGYYYNTVKYTATPIF